MSPGTHLTLDPALHSPDPGSIPALTRTRESRVVLRGSHDVHEVRVVIGDDVVRVAEVGKDGRGLQFLEAVTVPEQGEVEHLEQK